MDQRHARYQRRDLVLFEGAVIQPNDIWDPSYLIYRNHGLLLLSEHDSG